MKHLKLIWAFIGLVAIIYIATLLFIRVKSPDTTEYKIYKSWRDNYVVQKNSHQSFVNTSNEKINPVALSEGQGYGLYLTAKAGSKGWAKQKEYDRLLNYYLAHREYLGKKHNKSTYLIQWRQYKKNGKWVNNENSATDGDLFIAASLIQARKAWPHRGKYYQRIERKITDDILNYEYNQQTKTLTVGSWATKKSSYHNLMRTSDVAPKFFDSFYKSSHDRRWLTVKDNMLDRMATLSGQHKTGLVPDFAWVTTNETRPVEGKTVSNKYDGDYSANACRVPMMLAASKDPRAKKIVNKMLSFFSDENQITAGYTLAGKPINHYQTNSFKAPLFYVAKENQKSSNKGLSHSLQAIFSKPLVQNNYYDATLTTMVAMEGVN